MTFALTTLALNPERGHAVAFEMVDSVISNHGVLLVLESVEDVRPTPGYTLTVVDPRDGKWLGGLVEITGDGTPDGRCLARVVEWDAVFLGHVRDKAERRESLQLRARAVYVVRSLDADGE